MLSNTTPCTETDCKNGFVSIYNAYAADPLTSELVECEVCFGLGFIHFGDEFAEAD